MQQYIDLCHYVIGHGEWRPTRQKDLRTLGCFSPPDFRHNMADGFPILTTKKVAWKMAIQEMLWFISGSTDIKELGIAQKLWEPYADSDGKVQGSYGQMWSDFRGTDQFNNLLKQLKKVPHSRRHVVSSWDANLLERSRKTLPPCHTLFQVYLGGGLSGSNKILSLKMYQRSADLCVGVPFNIVGYGFLLEALAWEIGAIPGELIISYGDVHIYEDHLPNLLQQIRRQCLALPRLEICEIGEIYNIDLDNIKLADYRSHDALAYAFHP